MSKRVSRILENIDSMKVLKTASVMLILLLAACLPARAQREDLSVLYFYSPSCPPCDTVAPLIKNLSREFAVHGYVSGTGKTDAMPFKVDRVDETMLSRYHIDQFPSLVVMKNGSVRQAIIGEKDVKDAGLLLRALRNGALTVSEIVANKPQDAVVVSGWVVSKGEYFKDVSFYITDRNNTVSLRPWLPFEAVRSPWRKDRPRSMSDIINRPAVLEGIVTKLGDELQFTVLKEVIIE